LLPAEGDEEQVQVSLEIFRQRIGISPRDSARPPWGRFRRSTPTPYLERVIEYSPHTPWDVLSDGTCSSRLTRE
jgi:hypothetical protein